MPSPDHNADDDEDNENSSNACSNHADGNRESHRNEGSHGQGQRQHPPSPRRPPPRTNNNDRSSIRPPPDQFNPKQWLNDEDFCIQVGRSMFPVSDSERLKPKLKSTIDNLPTNIILTEWYCNHWSHHIWSFYFLPALDQCTPVSQRPHINYCPSQPLPPFSNLQTCLPAL
jgi:hypothetical protein